MVARATQSAKDSEDNKLILYRLDRVEAAVKDVGTKVENQDNIKKSDLIELKNTFIERITDVHTDLQAQVNRKADEDTAEERWKLVKAVAAFFATVISGLVIYYLTAGKG